MTATQFSLRKLTGWCLLALSSITFLLIFFVPFLESSPAEKIALAGSLYLASQITWWLCLPLLGKELLAWTKSAWQACCDKIKPTHHRKP
ncbi:MAG TPA: hypothetical protein VIM96_11010 [Pseudomonadales bacterium]